MITDKQAKLLRYAMSKYNNQRISAAKSGMSERSARKYLKTDKLPSELKKERDWRTRKNPFESVWAEVEEMLELTPRLTAKTLLTYLIGKYPGSFKESNLRSLQRQLQVWRSTKGPEKEVIFPQDIKPGRQSQSDYTCMNSLNITIGGKAFPHLLYHYMLPYSRWEAANVCYSESFASQMEGYERAVWRLGRQAPEHRTDNQSAVSKVKGGKTNFTQRWREFMGYYGVRPSCNNPGVSHENGSVEKSHHLLKEAIDQSLMLRGSRNFDSLASYEKFVEDIVVNRNSARQELLREEIDLLQDLPSSKYNAPIINLVKVSSASTVKIQGVIYSVPSRLIRYQLKALIYPNKIELYYGRNLVQSMPKLEAEVEYHINYRHIINELVKKPGAFENYKYKESLFPRIIFRKTYDRCMKISTINGHKKYLKILQLAYLHGEQQIAEMLEEYDKLDIVVDVKALEQKLSTKKPIYPEVMVRAPELKLYDNLMQVMEVM